MQEPKFFKKHDLLHLELLKATLNKIKNINKVAKKLGKEIINKIEVEAIKREIERLTNKLHG